MNTRSLADISEERQAELLKDAVDFHVHTAPDTVPRFATDIDTARQALDTGMRGVVVKNHVVPTAGRVDLTNRELDAEVLFGGVVLNGSVGGVNPDAVEVALNLGAEIIWLPTAWSHNHASQARAAGVERFAGQRVPGPNKEIRLLEDGSLRPEVRLIVEQVAEAGAILATGHVSVAASLIVAEACADVGTDCLVNHPFFRVIDASREELEQLVNLGATIECCAYSLIEERTNHSAERVAEAVTYFGPENLLLATDFGQVDNPPAEGLARFAEAVIRAGADETDVRKMLTETPAHLLGMG